MVLRYLAKLVHKGHHPLIVESVYYNTLLLGEVRLLALFSIKYYEFPIREIRTTPTSNVNKRYE
jgi:hypothetical protein